MVRNFARVSNATNIIKTTLQKKKKKKINTQKLEIKKVIELLKSHEKLEKLVGKFVYLQFLLQIYGNVCFLCLPTPLI